MRVGVLGRLVPPAHLDRIDGQRNRQFVERTAKPVSPGGVAGSALKSRRAEIERHDAMRRADVGTGVQETRLQRRRLGEILDARSVRKHIVTNLGETPGRGRRHAQVLLRARTRADGPEHLRAFEHQLDGPADQARRHDRERNMRPH